MNAQQAGREHFEAIFNANVRPVLGYALRRVDDAADAADVVAETFLVAWRRLDALPAADEARPWLFGVARRVLANQRRGQLRQNRLAEALRVQLSGELVFDQTRDTEDAQLLARALRRLADVDRELLQLTAWEGLTPAQLATAMAIPPATVRTRLHRARRRLRREMEDMHRECEPVDLCRHDRADEEEHTQDGGGSA
jgi:RNA polymerase sigma-70 factor (ECF subfamily)